MPWTLAGFDGATIPAEVVQRAAMVALMHYRADARNTTGLNWLEGATLFLNGAEAEAIMLGFRGAEFMDDEAVAAMGVRFRLATVEQMANDNQLIHIENTLLEELRCWQNAAVDPQIAALRNRALALVQTGGYTWRQLKAV